jgi:hypothetical protein
VLLFLIVGTVCVVFDSRFSNLNIDLRSFFGLNYSLGFGFSRVLNSKLNFHMNYFSGWIRVLGLSVLSLHPIRI